LRAYTSTDGGNTWSSDPGPAPDATCPAPPQASDPVLAIDLRGREYFAFVGESCAGQELAYVAARSGPTAAWTSPNGPAVSSLAGYETRRDDKPALVVDDSPSSPFRDRVYLIFQEITRPLDQLVLTYSRDGGATWSAPQEFAAGFIAALAVGPDGTLFAVWSDGRYLRMARSTDGGRTLTTPRSVVRIREASILPLASLDHGLSTLPSVAVFGDRVYLTFDDVRRGTRVGVYVKALTPDLKPEPGFAHAREVAAQKRSVDHFLPIIATDSASGRIWDCYYATDGNAARAAVRFSCSSSADGGLHWTRPVPAAAAFSRHPLPPSFEYGDYEGLAVSGRAAHPIWTDSRRRSDGLGTEVYTATLR
jgi:hypothetical protein